MTTTTTTTPTTTALATQVYHLFIRSTPDAIWEAITMSRFTEKYFHGSRIEITPAGRRSLGPEGEVRGDSPVLEFDPPHKLVHGWQPLYDPELAEEEPSRVTWEIEPHDGGYCKLTLTHDQLDRAPKTAENVYGQGWMMVISGLKTLLETGKSLEG